MKINNILESQLSEIDMDDYGDREEEFMRIKHDEDFTSVYDALDGLLADDDWPERVNAMFDDDIEDLKIDDRDLDGFRKMAVGPNGEIKRDIKQAVAKYAKDYDQWRNSPEANEYEDQFADSREQERDPYGYHGVSRRDFF